LRTGSVARATVVAVLDQGPGIFLHAHDVVPVADKSTLIGWRLMRFYPTRSASPLANLDLMPGDVLLSINDVVVERPEHLMAIWQALYTATEVRAVLARNLERIELHYQIVDQAPALPVVGAAPSTVVPSTAAPASSLAAPAPLAKSVP